MTERKSESVSLITESTGKWARKGMGYKKELTWPVEEDSRRICGARTTGWRTWKVKRHPNWWLWPTINQSASQPDRQSEIRKVIKYRGAGETTTTYVRVVTLLLLFFARALFRNERRSVGYIDFVWNWMKTIERRREAAVARANKRTPSCFCCSCGGGCCFCTCIYLSSAADVQAPPIDTRPVLWNWIEL